MPLLDEPVVLSTAYLPNIQYLSKLFAHKKIIIDINETYPKQSYRNRCLIAGANGVHPLSIPVKRPNGNHTLTRDIEIDYDTDWQRIHWRAILSAYNHSPFFEIFADEFQPLFGKRYKYLVELNEAILRLYFAATGYQMPQWEYTNDFVTPGTYTFDYRNTIHPKTHSSLDVHFNPQPYFQVFDEKLGFTSNLSFIDLLFNEGSQAMFKCKQHIH